MMIEPSANLTPRETQSMQYEREILDKQLEHQLEMKKLELEVTKVEAKWSSWLKLPSLIIKIPLFFLLGIAYIVSMITKKDVPPEFWNLLK